MVARQLARQSVDTSVLLGELLDEARLESAEFPVALANHGPMALTILQHLGAPGGRLLDYSGAYRVANGLVPTPPPVAPINRGIWTADLGDRSREGDYRAFFAREVALLGIGDAVNRYLPVLAPGVAGSALHPLMRLAYGIARNDAAEVGTALGYWAACFLPLAPATGTEPVTDDPGEVLARVAVIPGLHAVPAFDPFWYGMRAAVAVPDFAPVVDWLRIGPGTMARVASTSLALFAATMDFAALHAVTGTHWVRLVSTVCPDPMLLRYFWQAIASLVPAIGFPTLPDHATLERWRALPCPEWPAIVAQAIRSDDEHDISLIYSAKEEEQVYGDRLYRVVAARRLGLIR